MIAFIAGFVVGIGFTLGAIFLYLISLGETTDGARMSGWEIDDGETPSPQRQRVPGKRW